MAIHIRDGHVMRTKHFHQLVAEVDEMVKLLGENRIPHARFSRSRIMVILRDNFWPADSSRTFISPKGVGGKRKSEFHNERMEVAIGKFEIF